MMLEKIINIKPAVSYQGGKKSYSSSYEKFLNKPFARNAFGADSLAFSPAAVFLSKIDWRLKEIDISENEKLKINFYIENIEFETNIDFSEIENLSERKYLVSKNLENTDEKKRAEFIILLKKDKIALTENYLNDELNGINNFLQRIFISDFSFTLTSNDGYLINDLLSGIEDKLREEFNNIDSALFTFLNKLEKFPPIKNINFEEGTFEPMKVEKIKIYRD